MAHNSIKKTICQLLILGLGIYLVIVLSRELFYLMKKGGRIKEIEEKVERLGLKNKELKERLEYVKTYEFVEKEARDKLNMAKENEVIVVLPEDLEIQDKRLEQEREGDLANWQRWWRLFF